MAIALSHLGGQSIGIFGLARSGLATVSAAIAGGAAVVWAWDDRAPGRDAASALGARVAPISEWPWAALSSLVLAPGVPLTHPQPHAVVGQARQAGVEIICDIELLYREHGGQAIFVGITGTNGKSTTTALAGHILVAGGLPAQVGGNIGNAALDLDPPGTGEIYVLELSSYQLDLVDRFSADIAVWLNVTADHLDRHGDMAGYRAAKDRIFRNGRAGALRIIGVDEPDMRAVAESHRGERPDLWRVATAGPGRDRSGSEYLVDPDGNLVAASPDAIPVPLAAHLPLRGRHNLQNAAFAFLICRALGLDDNDILVAMATFAGLKHRMEIVGRLGRVVFVNDSKATNAEAAARALGAYERIYWIAGGRAKAGGIDGLADLFPRIAKAYLIGEAAERFSDTLAGQVDHVIAGDLASAVSLAGADAARDHGAEPVVLLSPAATSFDQFADFEARGRAFAEAARAFCRAGKQEMAS